MASTAPDIPPRAAPVPVDPCQGPADLVVISGEDADLAALSEARAAMQAPPGLRLLHLRHLAHPASVDRHLDACATKSRLVVIRLSGPARGWPYGVAQYSARCAAAGVGLALLPGEGAPDEARLQHLSTIPGPDRAALSACLSEGGAENAALFLAHAQAMLSGGPRPAAVAPVPRAGIFWPGAGIADLVTARAAWREGAPIVPVLFARALVHGTGHNPVARLTRALLRQGLNPLPVFAASLHDPASRALLGKLFADAPPSVIVNTLPDAPLSPGLPRETGVPVLQCLLASNSEEDWAGDPAGLDPADAERFTLLPELAGHVLARAIAFREDAFFDEATQCTISTLKAQGDRIEFTARLAAGWAALRHAPPGGRRIALLLPGQPGDPGAAARALGILDLLAANGYRVHNPPADPAALIAPHGGGIRMSLADYQVDYGQLPWEMREAMETRWGRPEDDPAYSPGEVDCGAFALPVRQFGNVALAFVAPPPECHQPPPHRLLALHFWLRYGFRAHALVQAGRDAPSDAAPGKAMALSRACWPEALLGPLPHIRLLAPGATGEIAAARRRAHALIVPDAADAGLLAALSGKAIAPPPTGATDPGSLPSPEAWARGSAAAAQFIETHLQTHGDWPRTQGLALNGLAALADGGAMLAQALALVGLAPRRDDATGRITALDITPAETLGRPRVDVTLHVDEAFREALPDFIALFEKAAGTVFDHAGPRILSENPG